MILSIIIISKNEEKFIGECIESVLKATAEITDKEIILVDSMSTDKTILIAKEYPITILQLRTHWRHSPAAGRYIGFLKSSGKYILFLDGDSFLLSGFVEKAVEYFENNNNIASIIGRRKEIYYDTENIVGSHNDINRIGDNPKFVTIFGGSAIFRREALKKVGSFNPYLFAEEEAELCDRLKQSGYKIMAIPFDMVVHNTLPRNKVKTLLQRMKSNLNLGRGQLIRYGIKGKISAGLFKKVMYDLRFIALLLSGLICGLISLISKNWYFLLSWIILCAFLFILFVIKSKSIFKPIKYLFIWLVHTYSIIKGILIKPVNPEDYPTDAIIVKQHQNE